MWENLTIPDNLLPTEYILRYFHFFPHSFLIIKSEAPFIISGTKIFQADCLSYYLQILQDIQHRSYNFIRKIVGNHLLGIDLRKNDFFLCIQFLD